MDYKDFYQDLLNCAKENAKKLNHKRVGTESILLAILESNGDGLKALKNAGVNPQTLYRSLMGFKRNKVKKTGFDLNFTPFSMHILGSAAEYSNFRRDGYVNSAHLLYGCLEEGIGVASSFLRKQVSPYVLKQSIDCVLDKKKSYTKV